MSNHTKQDLAAALKEILQEKPLEKVTVSEVTEKCGLSRMTFYYHFRDLYDLVEWMCIRSLKETAGSPKDGAAWQEYLTRIFQAMYVQKTYVTNINRSLDRAQIESFWMDQIYELLLKMVRSEAARAGADSASGGDGSGASGGDGSSGAAGGDGSGGGVSGTPGQGGTMLEEDEIAFIAGFYKYSFVGELMEWFDNGMKDDYEDIVADLSKMMEGSIEHAVRNFC